MSSFPHSRDAKTNLAPPRSSTCTRWGKSPQVEIDGTLIAESAAITEVL